MGRRGRSLRRHTACDDTGHNIVRPVPGPGFEYCRQGIAAHDQANGDDDLDHGHFDHDFVFINDYADYDDHQ